MIADHRTRSHDNTDESVWVARTKNDKRCYSALLTAVYDQKSINMNRLKKKTFFFSTSNSVA